MKPERWQRIEAIYHEASALAVDERAAYLREACGDDPALLAEVRSLLDEDYAQSFLDTPAARVGEANAHPPGVGQRLGNYVLLASLGTGSAGEVFRAQDTKRQREVAIRLVPVSFTADPQRLWRFERDARALAALKHPGIASIYGLKMLEHRQHAIILEMVHGLTVESRTASGAVPLPLALEYARQVAGALAAAHASRIVHGSIRTSNIVITFDGPCKVLDFGLGDADRTAPGDMRGFGRVLFQMATGHPPSEGLAGSYDAGPSALPPDLPVGVRALLAACLDARPERRPDAREVSLQLEKQHSG